MKPNASLDEIECTGTFFSLGCSSTIAGAKPKWKLLNTLTYGAGLVSLTLRHRWFSSTLDARASLVRQFGFTYHIPPEGRVLESRHYLDLAATTRIADRFALTVGVNNLTDAKAALTGNLQVQANTDPSLYDVLGRRFFVTLAARIR
jgi:outer membrane receptor protein involved in Fe transport